MHFATMEFAILMMVAFAGFWRLANHRMGRVLWLLAASYFFYGYYFYKYLDPNGDHHLHYLGLIFLSSSMDFYIGKRLSNIDRTTIRKLLLTVSVVVNLGILAVFKYFDFFSKEICELMSANGMQVAAPHSSLLVPMGISFYTFQTLSYTIDVYRKKLAPAKSYFDYLLFVSFFPQLVAGPIVRASTLLHQIDAKPKLTSKQGSRAVMRIATGLLKKALIADYLAVHVVDKVFANPEMYSSAETLVAVYGYAFQIYADFSAYSDIAIGCAALMGFTLGENFNLPYTAANLREFWQRWHISLSTWLRDYLYIPLGGSKNGVLKTYLALTTTMLLGGLWHGASINFVIWGAIHGGALVLTRIVQRLLSSSKVSIKIPRLLGVFFTFHLVCVAWIFFRAKNLEIVKQIFDSLIQMDWTTANLQWQVTLVLGIAFLLHLIPNNWTEQLRSRFHVVPAPLQAMVVILVVIIGKLLSQAEVAPFIYYQF